MSESIINCPSCQSQNIVKNGSIHNKKPKHKCKDCGRQFVKNSSKIYISQDQKDLIDKLLLERISLSGISRVTGVSKKWLQDYVNAKYSKVSQEIQVSEKKREKLIIQAIERLNNTLRQRISRLVRKSLSFSKKVENHLGAIWYFIHDYNNKLSVSS
jgi:transposase-like protein